MDFSWSDREAALRDRIAGAIRPLTDEAILSQEHAPLPDLKQTVLSLQSSLAQAGALAVGGDRESASRCMADAVHLAPLARASVSLFLSVRITSELGGVLASFGNAWTRDKLLDPLTKGRIIGAIGLSEPGEEAGLTPAHIVREGDAFRLTGTKSFVTNGPIADWVAVFSHLEGREAICLVPLDQQDVNRSARTETMGLNAIALCDLTFNDLLVPHDHLLGPFDSNTVRSWYEQCADLSIAVAACGLMDRALHAAKDHARLHRRGGKAVFSFQEVRFILAEMLTLSETAGLLTNRAAWALAAASPEARDLIRCAHTFAVENAERVAGMAMQITAAAGYRRGSVCERAYRDAKGLALAGTTVELSRMAIADEILERF